MHRDRIRNLHILLENHFGDLNENREEMLSAEPTAAELLDAEVMSMRQIAEADLGQHRLRSDRIRPDELLKHIRSMLSAAADTAGVVFELGIAPLLPAISGDSVRLQEAMTTVVRAVVVAAEPEARVRIEVAQDVKAVTVVASGGGDPRHSIRWTAAVRLIRAEGGEVEERARVLTIRLPVWIAT